MLRIVTTSLVGLLMTSGIAGLGCTRSPQVRTASTEGQLVEQRAVVLKQKADLMQKGEKMVADGRAMVARGNAMREQGNSLEGQNLVFDGEAKVKQGQNYLAQADALPLPSTQPSDVSYSSDRYDRDGNRDGTTDRDTGTARVDPIK